MSSNEKYCLRWNDFERNISIAFRDIREEKDLFDCTLSCGVRQLKAHKLILSACSPFFRTILRQNHHQHPLLYLKGVEYSDLQAVLDFMYHGEVNVAQEELNSFLAVAEDLQVKGLSQNENTTDSRPPPQNNQKAEAIRPKSYLPREDPKPPPRPPAPKNPLLHEVAHPVSQTKPQDACVEIVKQEPQPISSSVQAVSYNETEYSGELASMDESYTDEYEDYGYEGGMGDMGYEVSLGLGSGHGQQEDISNRGQFDYNTYMSTGYNETGVKMFICQLCGKSFKIRAHVKTHVESVHSTGAQVPCEICSKMFKNNESLKTHYRVKHGHLKYSSI